MDFLLNQNTLLLIVVALGSGLMLAWPMIQKSRSGAALSPTEAVQMMNHQHAVLVDIRDAAAFQAAHIPQARNLPVAEFEKKIASLPKNKPIILVCEQGRSAVAAAAQLRKLGIAEVTLLEGGLRAWSAAGMPVTAKKTGA